MKNYNLQKIDDLLLPQYKHLTVNDDCYFFMGYTPVWVGYTAENSIIMNFKKSMDRKGKGDWVWKEREIANLSQLFIQNAPPIIPADSILIPVPPSKAKGHELYDDRLLQLVNNYCAAHNDVECREIISIRNTITPTHDEEKSPEELIENFIIDEALCTPTNNTIVIVDDVLRHGSHFRAIKDLLQPRFPDSNIIGLFIAKANH